jgi:RiboL-PSP-HEPN
VTDVTDIAAKAILADFTADVDRVEQLLELIRVFKDFASEESQLPKYARELWDAAQTIRSDLPLLSGSLLLYLCGRFEIFIRELVRTVVDELVDKATRYEDLPAELRKVYLTRILSINENPNKYNHTREMAVALAAELADNLTGRSDVASALRVSATPVTITESNMRPNVMAEIFKRVGILNIWDTLGKQLPLRNHLGATTEDGCKKAAMLRLDDIMNERNKIAHPSGESAFPDFNIVKSIAEYFRVLAQVLADLAIAPR